MRKADERCHSRRPGRRIRRRHCARGRDRLPGWRAKNDRLPLEMKTLLEYSCETLLLCEPHPAFVGFEAAHRRRTLHRLSRLRWAAGRHLFRKPVNCCSRARPALVSLGTLRPTLPGRCGLTVFASNTTPIRSASKTEVDGYRASRATGGNRARRRGWHREGTVIRRGSP